MIIYQNRFNKEKVQLPVRVMITGYGAVAEEFVESINRHKGVFDTYGISFLITAIAGSEGMIYDDKGIDLPLLRKCGTGSIGLRRYSEAKKRQLHPAKMTGDVLIECSLTNIKNGGPALIYILEAIREKMDIVSVSKGALVHAYASIMAAAEENKVRIKYSGATAAALPTLDIGEVSLTGSKITKLEGVLNGTSNFILTAMQNELISYEEALNIAQEKGIAESNPALDVEGTDSACKLLLIANKLFHTQYTLNDVHLEGITQLTREMIMEAEERGEKVKLLCTAEKKENGVLMEIKPVSIKSDHPLYHAEGVEKGIVFHTEEMGRICCTGGASSPKGAAAAALKDLINLYRNK